MPKEQDLHIRLRELTKDVRELRREIDDFRMPRQEHPLARANDERLPRRTGAAPDERKADRRR